MPVQEAGEGSRQGGPRRVLIIDDHEAIADSLKLALTIEPTIDCIGVATSLAEAEEVLRRERADVILLDIHLPDGSGLDGIGRLQSQPGVPAVVVLTGDADPVLLQQAVRAGASSYLLKGMPLRDIIEAIRLVGTDRALLNKHVLAAAVGAKGIPGDVQENTLTMREQDVLVEMGQGHHPAKIAQILGLSAHTVRGHMKRIFSKLDAHSQLEAVVEATRRGWLVPGGESSLQSTRSERQ